jgi:hypothetical protein
MNDLRSRAKFFYNALDMDKPVGHGLDKLDVAALPQSLYIEQIHGNGQNDPVQQLADQIDFAASAGSYLFTGNRGTGKTTELLRLAKILDSYRCEVFYADLSEYLNLTQRIEVSDFLIAVLGALSEKVHGRFGEKVAGRGYFERIRDFLYSEVSFTEVKFGAGGVDLKAALSQNPTFKETLQQKTRGHIETLVKQAREFVLEVVDQVRRACNDPDRKVVLIIDSVERLRGVGDAKDVHEVFKSAETLFSAHAEKLRFTGLNIVYTVPPYLQALAGSLGSYYAGGRVYSLPSVHIYEGCPVDGAAPKVDNNDGPQKMLDVVEARYPDWRDFFNEIQLRDLAQAAGGDLRDFFRMLRLAITRAPGLDQLPLNDTVLADAKAAVRNDMLPIAADDLDWLERVALTHKAALESLDNLPDFARLQQSKYLLHYRNGEDWWDIHPLLRDELRAHVNKRKPA